MKRVSSGTVALLGAAALFASCDNMKRIKLLPYPETERGDVVDNYFGTEVPDPYRWLEDDNSEATAAWVEAENAVTQDYLSQIPFRGAIRERLTEVWNYPKESAPSKHGDWWYYYYNDGLQNQSVIYRTRSRARPARCSSTPISSPTTGRWPWPPPPSRRTAAISPMPPRRRDRTGWRSA